LTLGLNEGDIESDGNDYDFDDGRGDACNIETRLQEKEIGHYVSFFDITSFFRLFNNKVFQLFL
jgi:hypothetical protein